MNIEIIILCVAFGLLTVVTVCLAVHINTGHLRDKIKKDFKDIMRVDSGTYWQKISETCLKEHHIAEWIKMQSEDENIDLLALVNGANARTIALTLKLAEDDVNSAANVVKRIRDKLYQAKNHLIATKSHHPLDTATEYKENDIIAELKKQEIEAIKHLEEAQENLKKLLVAIETTANQPQTKSTDVNSSAPDSENSIE